jgi:hypothetical protein
MSLLLGPAGALRGQPVALVSLLSPVA